MPEQLRVSIVVIGDEILGGYVADANSPWLAAQLRRLGLPLDRIVTVPDDVPAIGQALRAELARARPRVVLTSGGIGSTPDDRTMAAVAASLGRRLEVQPRMDALISDMLARQEAAGAHLDAAAEMAMRKMARAPEGASLLPGARGVAPGVALDVDGGVRTAGGATVVVLPGVPSELRRIVSEGVVPALLAGRGVPPHVVELRHPYPESVLTPVLDEVAAAFPDLHVGSYPGRECLIRLRGNRAVVETAAARVRAYLDEVAAGDSAEAVRARWQAHWTEDPRSRSGRRRDGD